MTRGKEKTRLVRRRKHVGDAAALRLDVIATARATNAERLSVGRSGNVSCRFEDGMLITPTGVPYDALTPDGIVFVDGEGKTPPGALLPSSEWRFHQAAYQARPDANGVVHTHSLYATALACAHKPIPAFHYMVAAAGGDDIPLVPYAPFGTAELADHVRAALKERKACLMANHGQIATGGTLALAFELAREVEWLSAQYTAVLQLGRPKLLDRTEMEVVLERFAAYGQQSPTDHQG